MKKFNLFLAFLVCSTVAMANDSQASVSYFDSLKNMFSSSPAAAPVAKSEQAPAAVEAPASEPTWINAFNGFVASAKGCASTVSDYTVTPVNNALNSADAVVVEKAQTYVVAPSVNLVNSAVNYAQPVTDKVVEYAALAKNVTSDAVASSLAHPVTSMVVAAAAYVMYYAYTEYNAAAKKKSKN